jgi:uncharacterized Zn finger protein
MSWSFGWKPYVPVAERRAQAARELAKLAKKTGLVASPVLLEGRKIANTFWGKAWCDNLEAYSDFASRLPRGRTYVRNGSVVHLQVSPGKIIARVSGSELYQIEIKIKPLAADLWKSIQVECAGKIDSLMELLQGKLSSSVMQIVTRQERGLFPTPKEIGLDCSCPDWADLCKHVAASLYGVGARLDQHPELLFLLRGVDPADLISQASAAETVRQTAQTGNAAAMSETEMADVFGIELAAPSPQASEAPKVPVDAAKVVPAPQPKTKPPKRVARSGRTKQKAGRKGSPVRRMSAAGRARLAAAMRARWQKLRGGKPKVPSSKKGR